MCEILASWDAGHLGDLVFESMEMLIKFATLQPDLISKAPLEAFHSETYHIDEHIPYLYFLQL